MFADRPEPSSRGGVPSPPPLDALWSRRDLVLGAILVIGAIAGLTAVVVVLARLHLIGRPAALAASVLMELLLGGVVVLLARRRGVTWAGLGFVRPTEWGIVAMGWLGAYGIVAVYFGLVRLLGRAGVDISAFTRGNPVPLRGDEGVVSLAVLGLTVVLLAPLAEELFFRGLLYRGFRGAWGPGVAMLASGAAFGVFHLNLSVAVPFTLIGVLFGWLMERSRSLWPPIVAHVLVNGVSFVAALVFLGP